MAYAEPYISPPNKHRIDVLVVAEHDFEGRIKPVSFTTKEGITVDIDRVMRVKKNIAAMKGGGQGDCYIVRVTFKDRQVLRKLFHGDNGRWFIERD